MYWNEEIMRVELEKDKPSKLLLDKLMELSENCWLSFSGKDLLNRQDIIHDVFIRLLENYHKCDTSRPSLPYLTQVGKIEVYHSIRKMNGIPLKEKNPKGIKFISFDTIFKTEPEN